jgi:hypothetical protein
MPTGVPAVMAATSHAGWRAVNHVACAETHVAAGHQFGSVVHEPDVQNIACKLPLAFSYALDNPIRYCAQYINLRMLLINYIATFEGTHRHWQLESLAQKESCRPTALVVHSSHNMSMDYPRSGKHVTARHLLMKDSRFCCPACPTSRRGGTVNTRMRCPSCATVVPCNVHGPACQRRILSSKDSRDCFLCMSHGCAPIPLHHKALHKILRTLGTVIRS